nr:MAG TPA: replisome organizer protein [Caudoviricetes sp.]DAK39479.1 MAG TPA: replisome organizer protein [Caudoviricetes sp.]
MKVSDIPQFIAMLATFSDYYDRPRMSDEKALVYFDLLQEFTLEEVRTGFRDAMRNPEFGQFMPKAADVRRVLLGSGEANADRAWAKVREAICRVGHMPSIAFDDAIIHAVIADMGGWVKLALITNDELPFRERDFLRIYRGYIGRPLGDYPRYLPGMAETENFAKGYAVEPPLLLGDASKAEQVLLAGSDKPRLAVQPMQAAPDVVGGVLRDMRRDSEGGGLRRLGVEVPA